MKDKHTVSGKMVRNSRKIAILLLLFVLIQTICMYANAPSKRILSHCDICTNTWTCVQGMIPRYLLTLQGVLFDTDNFLSKYFNTHFGALYHISLDSVYCVRIRVLGY